MNRGVIILSLFVSLAFVHLGTFNKSEADGLRRKVAQLKSDNLEMKQEIKVKEDMVKRRPVPLPIAFAAVMNETRILESDSGKNMNVQLEDAKDAEDISTHYVATSYRGVRGLKIKIVIDKFSKETDMGAVLDDIHLLEKNTDFIAEEINKDSNHLIVKGEIYGI